MYLLRQRYLSVEQSRSVQSLTECRKCWPIDTNGFPGEKKGHAFPFPVANYPHMNFTQMHERLRLKLLRRINRGTLRVSLLARQTGFSQAHLSNFLHSERQLSLQALDRVMAAQHMDAEDFLPVIRVGADTTSEPGGDRVPIEAQANTLFEPYIRRLAVHSLLQLPHGILKALQPRATKQRRAWQRFVAVHISPEDAEGMMPLVMPGAIALIDRHYNSLAPHRPDRPNIFAQRNGSHLRFRHADFLADRLVLRPHDRAIPVELVELGPHESPGDLIAGRIALIVNEV